MDDPLARTVHENLLRTKPVREFTNRASDIDFQLTAQSSPIRISMGIESNFAARVHR